MIWMSSEETPGRGDKKEVRSGNQAKHEVIDNGHHMCCGMFLEASLIFTQSHIARVM